MSNGTALLTGTWTNTTNPNQIFQVEFRFTGRFSTSNPKGHECGRSQGNIVAYSVTEGVLTGQGAFAGVVLRATGIGPPFQVGQNANITNNYDSFGASGWFSVAVQSGNISIGTGPDGQSADINVNLWESACSRSREFTNFNAFQADRAVDLEWVTNTTYKDDAYVLEKSTNGVDFEALTTIQNEAFSADPTYFKSEDPAPSLGDNFYRLKQIFEDGTAQYSDIKSIHFGIDLSSIEVFPNPAEGELFINLQTFAGKKGNLSISNQFGQILEEVNLDDVPSDILRLDVAAYNNGLYFMTIKLDRSQHFTQKFLVSKMY